MYFLTYLNIACIYIKNFQSCIEHKHYHLMFRQTTSESCWQKKNLKYKKDIKNIKRVKIQRRVQAKGFSASKIKCPGQFSALN